MYELRQIIANTLIAINLLKNNIIVCIFCGTLLIKKSAQKRWFQIKIEHGLRDKVLVGIENIGIRLFPLQDSLISDSTSLLPVSIKTQKDKK